MKVINYITILLVLGLLHSCDSYLDVNTDPTRISEENLAMPVLLPTIIEASAKSQQEAGLNAQLVTHQLDRIQAGYYDIFTSNSAWEELYLKCFNNTKVLEDLALENASPHYEGIAQVLTAINMGLATDTWENIPFSDAANGSADIMPAYDTQESIYNRLFSLLDEAITNLQSAESTFSPEGDDLIYGGDVDKWIKAAYSLKARYTLHLSNKSSVDYQAILNDVDRGFGSNEDDLQLSYRENFTNAWFDAIAKSFEQGIFNYTYGVDFMNILNGEQYGVIDPRLPKLATKIEEDEGYTGLESWINDQVYNVLPDAETFYMTPTGSLFFMMYSELKFIEAEAAFRLGQTDRAQAAYVEGIRSHMTKLGVEQADIDTYLNHESVNQLDLEHIMKEKLIATVFNLEAWNDMRRLGFDTSIYPAFMEPDYLGRSEPILRADYPNSEKNRNSANESENRKDVLAPMWKDLN